MLCGSMVTSLLKCILFIGHAFKLKVCQVLKIESGNIWAPLIFYDFKICFTYLLIYQNILQKILM